jgi:hypothetical protein
MSTLEISSTVWIAFDVLQSRASEWIPQTKDFCNLEGIVEAAPTDD